MDQSTVQFAIFIREVLKSRIMKDSTVVHIRATDAYKLTEGPVLFHAVL